MKKPFKIYWGYQSLTGYEEGVADIKSVSRERAESLFLKNNKGFIVEGICEVFDIIEINPTRL